ncbi:MAG: hypothetical protein ACQEST_10035, partial [Bacteroidota bacterium]
MRNNRLYYHTAIGFSFILLLIGAMPLDGKAQSFDHEAYPKLDFELLNLDLTLGVQPQNLQIDGEAVYQVEANISGADTLTLYASHLDISDVSVDGESADYSLHNDSLFIPVDDSTEAENQYEVRIRYSGQPGFGMLRNSSESIWTSLLPKAQRHWVPIIDNPNVELHTQMDISVPSGYQVWASGDKVDEETSSVEVMRYQFESTKEIPASSLAFAVAEFSESSSRFGDKKLNVAVEKSWADSIQKEEITERAQVFLGEIENYLEVEYPFDVFQVVVLGDHSWEPKNWAAGTVFLYANGGDIETQLKRGILGQWFGIQQRERQWAEGDAVTLYQTLILQELSEGEHQLEQTDTTEEYPQTVYDHFGIDRWNEWQKGISEWQGASVRSHILHSANRVMNELPGVIQWSDFADEWYQQTGQPIFEFPQFSVDESESESAKDDSVAYEVFYDFDEADGELTLRFEAKKGSYDELTSL